MTPEQVRELAATVRDNMENIGDDSQYAEIDALTDELLRHLGAPRVPTKISTARLAEIEGWLNDRGERSHIDEWNSVYCMTYFGEWQYWRETMILIGTGHLARTTTGPHPTLRAAMEAPVVRRAGCPPVIEFEVEQ